MDNRVTDKWKRVWREIIVTPIVIPHTAPHAYDYSSLHRRIYGSRATNRKD